MTQLQIEYVDPRSLTFKKKNRNAHPDDQIELLKKLIEHNGFRVPIIVSTLSGEVVAGNGRLRAALALELDSVPIIYQNFSSEDEEWQFHIADNAIQGWSDLDLSAINVDLSTFGPLDIDLLAIKDFLETPEDKKEKKGKKREVTCPQCGHEFSA